MSLSNVSILAKNRFPLKRYIIVFFIGMASVFLPRVKKPSLLGITPINARGGVTARITTAINERTIPIITPATVPNMSTPRNAAKNM